MPPDSLTSTTHTEVTIQITAENVKQLQAILDEFVDKYDDLWPKESCDDSNRRVSRLELMSNP